MNVKRSILAAGAAIVLSAGAIMLRADMVSEPAEEETPELSGATSSAGGHAANATGGYHFTIPAGIFPRGPIHNRVTFNAKRDDDGTVNGMFMYEQEVDGDVFRLGGPVTCFKVYDTPVLPGFPEIPAQSQNRAKWGGRIENTNDPTLLGVFAWFTSIDNGEGANGWSDISALVAVGTEEANEAFCNSPNTPRRPFAIDGGNIQVH